MPTHRVLAVVLAAATFLILPAATFAQALGVKAGVNFASLPPEEDEHPDVPPRAGPVGGVWLRTVPRDRWSFQAEALFSEKGTHWHFSPDVKIEIRLRYFEIPLLTRADFSARTARIFVVGGAAPAIKLSARAKSKFQEEEGTRDVGRAFERFDLGLIGGVGAEFGRALIEARYTHGILGINTDDNEPQDRLNNRAFSVTMGFRLR
jgi:hypothetical protein